MKAKLNYTSFKFFLWAFVLSWAYWVPCALDHFGWLPFKLPASIVAFAGVGTLGPALAALLLAFQDGGNAGIRMLLKHLWSWPLGWRWIVAAVAIYPTLLLLAGGLYNRLDGEPRLLPEPISAANVLVLALMLTITVLGEEIGWRGYALPALQARWNALWSSLLLGTVWTLWHVPFWMLQPSFVAYGWEYIGLNWIWILAATIFITWLMNNTQNSLLLAFLFHWCLNMMNVGYLQVTGNIQAYLILIAFSVAIAMMLLVIFGPKHLVRFVLISASGIPGKT